MSFSTGGLFHHESVELATMYLEQNDWNLVRDKAISENLFQVRTKSSLKRTCREVIARLKTLTRDELEFLVEANPQEQGYLLWAAVCRLYPFVYEFATEELRERYLSLKQDLSYEDFDSFFFKKSEWNSRLEEITTTTQKKLRQVLFRILRETNLLTTNHLIQAAFLTPMLVDLISRSNPQDLLCFPIFESDLKDLAL